MLGVTLQWTSIPSWGEQKFSYFMETRQRGPQVCKACKGLQLYTVSNTRSLSHGESHIKTGSGAKEPLREAKILFYGCGLKCLYPPQSYQFLSYIFFWFNTTKTYCKRSCCRHFEAKQAKRNQPAFSTLKSYNKYPCSLNIRDPHSH